MPKLAPQKIRNLILLIVGIVFVIVYFIGNEGIFSILRMELKNQELAKEIEELRAKNSELKTNIDLLQNDSEFQEKIAREELSMQRLGEIVYIIIPENDE